MLRRLKLQGVGPAPELELELGERINVLTGDNGLGKSFLLDVAWWALTRTWPGAPALPLNGQEATIECDLVRTGTTTRKATFDRQTQEWPAQPLPGTAVVVYARVDGGFSVFDPSRNWSPPPGDRPPAYHFDARQVWAGLELDGRRVCDGLERDWVSWQKGRETQFTALEHALTVLSPPDLSIRAGAPRRVFLGEGFDRPTLRIGDQDVPVVLASAGIRRILALAYLLVWSWHEHRIAAELRQQQRADRMVLLVDEPETHLHPSWQRRILPAVLRAAEQLTEGSRMSIQLLAASHAPMILASLEPEFDEERDRLFHLSQANGRVQVEQIPWSKQGDATNWLVSEAFGLQQARSAEAERAIEAAEAFMRGDTAGLPPGLGTPEAIHAELMRVLAGHDEFWPRWVVHREKQPQR